MQTSFNLDGELFEVEMIMSNVDIEEPSPFLEILPLEGSMVGNTFIIGEFKFTEDDESEDSDNLSFNIVFTDKSKQENDELCKLHLNTINTIVTNIFKDIADKISDENL